MIHLQGITADKIKEALAIKHKGDIFVTECKNGSTYFTDKLLKLDAWAMPRSWSHFSTIGYEIKCHRSDFEQDQKWVDYLDYCHAFYFVCPGGLIQSHELPKGVGLIWVSSTLHLHTKKKADPREPDKEKLRELLIYVLMARAKIIPSNFNLIPTEESRPLEERKQYIEECNAKKELAYMVKGHIREMSEHLITETKKIEQREKDIQRFTKSLEKLGIKWDTTRDNWQETGRVENEICMLKNVLPDNELWHLRHLAEDITKVVDNIEALREKEKPVAESSL